MLGSPLSVSAPPRGALSATPSPAASPGLLLTVSSASGEIQGVQVLSMSRGVAPDFAWPSDLPFANFQPQITCLKAQIAPK